MTTRLRWCCSVRLTFSLRLDMYVGLWAVCYLWRLPVGCEQEWVATEYWAMLMYSQESRQWEELVWLIIGHNLSDHIAKSLFLGKPIVCLCACYVSNMIIRTSPLLWSFSWGKLSSVMYCMTQSLSPGSLVTWQTSWWSFRPGVDLSDLL